jgi:hypothetical protein
MGAFQPHAEEIDVRYPSEQVLQPRRAALDLKFFHVHARDAMKFCIGHFQASLKPRGDQLAPAEQVSCPEGRQLNHVWNLGWWSCMLMDKGCCAAQGKQNDWPSSNGFVSFQRVQNMPNATGHGWIIIYDLTGPCTWRVADVGLGHRQGHRQGHKPRPKRR